MKQYRLIILAVVLSVAVQGFAEEKAYELARKDKDGICRLIYFTDDSGKEQGIFVVDMNDGYRFLKHIEVQGMTGQSRGCCGALDPGRLFIGNNRYGMICFDLLTEKKVWDVQKFETGGCDRSVVTPDGKKIYAPAGYYNGSPDLKVIDAATGKVRKLIKCVGSQHNMVMGKRGRTAYLGPIASDTLFVIDTETDTVAKKIGPFRRGWNDAATLAAYKRGEKIPGRGRVSPFTINGSGTLAFVNSFSVGFLLGDLTTGEIIHHAEVPRSDRGRAKFSHGLGLTRDETEVWVQGGFVFDVTVMPPKYKTKIDYWPGSHGWITFSLDGKYALPDNGVVYNVKTKKVVAELRDENGKRFVGYRHIEVHFKDGKPHRMGDQIGKGGLDVPPQIEGWSPATRVSAGRSLQQKE